MSPGALVTAPPMPTAFGAAPMPIPHGVAAAAHPRSPSGRFRRAVALFTDGVPRERGGSR